MGYEIGVTVKPVQHSYVETLFSFLLYLMLQFLIQSSVLDFPYSSLRVSDQEQNWYLLIFWELHSFNVTGSELA